jgi:hypothetical protein
MAGQGKTTRDYAEKLRQEGWGILFLCIPNTVHVGVVPIMTSHGVSKQRYPDIAALSGNTILLVEVEMALTDAITEDIILRFREMREGMSNPNVYRAWASKVGTVTGLDMPSNPVLETRLLIVKGITSKVASLADRLSASHIPVFSGKA